MSLSSQTMLKVALLWGEPIFLWSSTYWKGVSGPLKLPKFGAPKKSWEKNTFFDVFKHPEHESEVSLAIKKYGSRDIEIIDFVCPQMYVTSTTANPWACVHVHHLDLTMH